jgi:hypothetical protein
MPDEPDSASAMYPGWELLPPLEEVIEACQVFIKSYFQLGFLPRIPFFERLRKHQESISVFLLLTILSISAKFTPCLVRRYGDGRSATDTFLQRAGTLVVDHLYRPSLDAIQGFFLMSLAEWGKGDKHRSSIHMGVAVRMAGILRLHREETYYVSDDACPEEVVRSEAARRTFWMLENHDSLYSGYTSLASFSLGDITTLLPCEEHEFAFGISPRDRAALEGTAAAAAAASNGRPGGEQGSPSLSPSRSRSLFATLIQCHNLWGQIARRVARNEIGHQSPPKSPGVDNTSLGEDEYTRLSKRLQDFEDALPSRHRWSVWNLRGFRAEGLDLAYLSIVMIIKLSNIILRRSFAQAAVNDHDHEGGRRSGSASGSCERRNAITAELVSNMVVLHEQIQAFFALRSPHQGFPAFIVFCIYICGSLANHLLQCEGERSAPAGTSASRAMEILESSTESLESLQEAWPMAQRWSNALNKAYQRQKTKATSSSSSSVVIDPGLRNHNPPSSAAAHLSTSNLAANSLSSESHLVPLSFAVFGGPLASPVRPGPGPGPSMQVPNENNDGTTDLVLDEMNPNGPDGGWDDTFLDPSWTTNLDSEWGLYLWPGGDVWNDHGY